MLSPGCDFGRSRRFSAKDCFPASDRRAVLAPVRVVIWWCTAVERVMDRFAPEALVPPISADTLPPVPSAAPGVGSTDTTVRRFAPPDFESGCPGPVASEAVTVGSIASGGEDEHAEAVVGGAHVGSA